MVPKPILLNSVQFKFVNFSMKVVVDIHLSSLNIHRVSKSFIKETRDWTWTFSLSQLPVSSLTATSSGRQALFHLVTHNYPIVCIGRICLLFVSMFHFIAGRFVLYTITKIPGIIHAYIGVYYRTHRLRFTKYRRRNNNL